MPGRYTRQRTRIGTTTIERVTRMMRAGTVPGAGLDIADEGTQGLILLVNKNFAVWFLKTKHRTVRLGDLRRRCRGPGGTRHAGAASMPPSTRGGSGSPWNTRPASAITRRRSRSSPAPSAPPAIVELAGPRDYSPAEVADRIGAALGRPVAPIAPPRETWVPTLVGAGIGEAYATLLASMYDAITSGHVRFSGEGASRSGETTLDEVVAKWIAEAAAAAT